jgi:hypothetical protein
MKKTIGALAGLILLLLPAFAQADLSGNLLENGDFTGAGITSVKNIVSFNLSHGEWYSSGPNWKLISSDSGTIAYAELGNNKTQHLFQAVQVSKSLPGYTATAGPVLIQFDYKSKNIDTDETIATLYGSVIQPTYGNSPALGIPLGTLNGLNSVQNTWLKTSLWLNPDTGYDWYTLVISGLTKTGGASFGVDNVSVQVTPVPIPPAIWLLISGLTGLGAVRRRFRKK